MLYPPEKVAPLEYVNDDAPITIGPDTVIPLYAFPVYLGAVNVIEFVPADAVEPSVNTKLDTNPLKKLDNVGAVVEAV
jgi:hypothetical protein